jgi:hypothetical protein
MNNLKIIEPDRCGRSHQAQARLDTLCQMLPCNDGVLSLGVYNPSPIDPA